jgi:hypothetical protein
MSRRLIHASLLIALCACRGGEETATRQLVPFTHTYSYFADSARSCTEATDYKCTCRPLGYYEGTLLLTGHDSTVTGGNLRFRSCFPDQPACDPDQTEDVLPPPGLPSPFRAAGPPPTFCVFDCPHDLNDGAGQWAHFTTSSPSQNLVGRYDRRRGSYRGCGFSAGPFTATRM